uniref:RRM domain-containing protein n=1 Tax=Leptocylindrus danicus TaxID=163516 RepID=A0A7S2PLN1_9STRA
MSDDSSKIFVGGLSWQTTEESLQYHFQQYGEVASVEVMRDRNTGDPRGFAFVVFRDEATVDLVMSERRHEINHKIVDVKRAQARGTAPPSIHHDRNMQQNADDSSTTNDGGGGGSSRRSHHMSPEMLQNKIFIGGLPLFVDKEELMRFFEQFGNVVDAIVMVDQNTKRSRGFGFVTFEDGTGGAQKALNAQPLHIHDKYVEIKLAQPKENVAVYGKGLRNPGANAVYGPGGGRGHTGPVGEYTGLSASYGRSGWKAGYASYAFGKFGWDVEGWDVDGPSPPPREKGGFSFSMLRGNDDGAHRSHKRSRRS